MVMRTMRENTKWIMMILTIAFVGWLVFDWVQGGGMAGGQAANPVVGRVNGEPIRYSRWSQFVQQQLEQARQQVEAGLTDEQTHRIRENSWEQLVNQTLIQQELQRLDIAVTEAEIRQAFRSSPPPSLRDHPAFQTDGQFDYQKYRDFFSNPGVNDRLLLQIEQYYRETLPRSKLYGLISQEVVLTEEELWEIYRHRNERARVRYLAVNPATAVPDTAVRVTRAQVESYYREHTDEFERPRTAVVDLVSLTAEPSAGDSARARSAVDSLRNLAESGQATFAELVEEARAQEADGIQGSQMGPVSRGELIPALARPAFSLPVGTVSDPIRSPSGFHLVRVESRESGRVTLQQLLVPVRLSPDSEDRLYDRMDRLEGIALRSDLATAADSLGLRLRDDVELTEGSRFVPGAGALAVALDWAFDPQTRVGDLSQFFENSAGFHLLELEGRRPSRVLPLEEVEGQIRATLVREEKRRLARERLQEVVARVRSGERSLADAARSRGWETAETDFFTRTEFVPGLGRGTEAVGAAFGLEEGEIAGPVDAGSRVAAVRLVERRGGSREAFDEEAPRFRRQLRQELASAHLNRWIQALRESAKIVDLRDQLGSGRSSDAPPGGRPTS